MQPPEVLVAVAGQEGSRAAARHLPVWQAAVTKSRRLRQRKAGMPLTPALAYFLHGLRSVRQAAAAAGAVA